MGLRLDDGTDDNYSELYTADYSTIDGMYQVNFRYRISGGTPVVENGPIYPNDQPCHFALYNYTTGSGHLVYILNEASTWMGGVALGRGSVSMTTSRVGIIVDGASGYTAYCDWFLSNFS